MAIFDVDYYDLGFLARALEVIDQPGGPSVVVGSKRGPGVGRHPGPVPAAGDVDVQHHPPLRVRAQGVRHPRDESAAAGRRGGPGATVEVRHRPVRHRARHPGRAGRHAGRRAAGRGGRDPAVAVVDRPPHPPVDRGPGPPAGGAVAGGPAARPRSARAGRRRSPRAKRSTAATSSSAPGGRWRSARPPRPAPGSGRCAPPPCPPMRPDRHRRRGRALSSATT